MNSVHFSSNLRSFFLTSSVAQLFSLYHHRGPVSLCLYIVP